MPRIRQLDSLVVNKIAAGEVIERPASVVKELLENSIDALATRVEVDIAQGGTELIRVVDDGEGIHPDDLLLAVTSHATSKIDSADDLFRVRTMGFRGEALASIAAVSRMRIRSRQEGFDTGYEIEADGGDIRPPQACGCPQGTCIEVRALFGNTPVRRKFLKSVATEFGHISEQFTRVALANPRLHAVLRHNGRLVYEVPASDRLLDRLQLFYGSQLTDKLIWVESRTDAVRLWGYVGHPSESKATRKGEYVFLNGRWIQDRSLQHALSEAYRGLLMVGRYPVAFLYLEVPPDQVDVNVHPTKSEVRFRDSQQLYRQLLSTLRTKFLGMDLGSTIRVPQPAEGIGSPAVGPDQQRELQQELALWARQQLTNFTPIETTDDIEFPEEQDRAAPGDGFSPLAGIDAAHMANGNGTVADSQPAPPPQSAFSPPAQPQVPNPQPHSPAPARVMQVHDCYLVVETDDGLTVIDQHALHERVMYEHLRRRVLGGAVESQRMLVPEPVELDPGDAALLLEHRDLLAELGFAVEEFGGSTVLLSGYPAMLARADHPQLVRDLVERLRESGPKPSRRDLLDSLLHMMSCKAAIKAGQRLTPEEMESLVAQRHLIDDSHHCPHGRPTALTLTRAELDRQFGRLG